MYLIDFDTKSFVSVTETGKVYYVKDAQFIQDANIDAPDGFEDGARVTIDGKAYIAKSTSPTTTARSFSATALKR